jgi:hypothetical protein
VESGHPALAGNDPSALGWDMEVKSMVKGSPALGLTMAVVLGACAGDGPGSAPPTMEPSSTSSSGSVTSLTTTPLPTSTLTAATSTSEMPLAALEVLRADGLATVDFGAGADEALAELTALLGQPDRHEVIGPDRDCVEGSAWRDCVPVVRAGRIVGWSPYGLDVLLTDARGQSGAAPLRFGAWHAVAGSATPRLATKDGLAPGASTAAVRSTDAAVQFFSNEGIVDTFQIDTTAGPLLGTFRWDSYEDHVRALQRMLNERGAALAIDGIAGARTEQACIDFSRAHGLGDVGCPGGWLTTEMADALGFPPSDTPIASLFAPA